MHVPLLSWATGSEAKATLGDRFPRRVCENEKKNTLEQMWTPVLIHITLKGVGKRQFRSEAESRTHLP